MVPRGWEAPRVSLPVPSCRENTGHKCPLCVWFPLSLAGPGSSKHWFQALCHPLPCTDRPLALSGPSLTLEWILEVGICAWVEKAHTG